MSSANDSFVYTPGVNFTGTDSFQYQAQTSTMQSNVATVHITINSSSLSLLPKTPFFNYIRRRRSINPARFDFYHPRIGALIGMEISGIPTTPTTIVSKNAHFNADGARKLHAKNPQQFDQNKPVFGAFFQLEAPGSGQAKLLPGTAYYNEQRALYDSNPTQYQLKNVYLGALFAIEDIEQGGSAVLPTSTAPFSDTGGERHRQGALRPGHP